jgi:hypothetical protein
MKHTPTPVADTARSIKTGTGIINLKSDHRALCRPDGSNVVARAAETQVTRPGVFAMTVTRKRTDRVIPLFYLLTQ